jgi:hypothetical protein
MKPSRAYLAQRNDHLETEEILDCSALEEEEQGRGSKRPDLEISDSVLIGSSGFNSQLSGRGSLKPSFLKQPTVSMKKGRQKIPTPSFEPGYEDAR